jgi:sigma-54 specific flagellar transcriptional regulator A
MSGPGRRPGAETGCKPCGGSVRSAESFRNDKNAQQRDSAAGQSARINDGVRFPSGASPAIRAVESLIRQVAVHDSTVLLLGESGTGKEVAARAIHQMSPRRDRPFVAINCGAIPSELLESELFGHEKGAFTGAVNGRKGRFELACGGTLFLDEIGDMTVPMQVKLLRVLQERVFERVGSHVSIRCNVRIIAATHRNLEQEIQNGSFREDLFHRLNVFPIEMPALRKRAEDLPALIGEFVAKNVAEGRPHVQLSSAAMAALARHPWPGNVRELGNLVEKLSIMSGGRPVEVQDLPLKYRAGACVSIESISEQPRVERVPVDCAECIDGEQALRLLEDQRPSTTEDFIATLPAEGIDLRAFTLKIERQLIAQALVRSNGTVARAAALLHLRRTTLVEKMRRLQRCATDNEASD